jgi:hypothetical protein
MKISGILTSVLSRRGRGGKMALVIHFAIISEASFLGYKRIK